MHIYYQALADRTILSPRWFSSFVRSTEWGVAITCLVQIIIFIIIKVMMESHHLYHHKSEDGISFNIIKVMDYHPTDHLRSNKSHPNIIYSWFDADGRQYPSQLSFIWPYIKNLIANRCIFLIGHTLIK